MNQIGNFKSLLLLSVINLIFINFNYAQSELSEAKKATVHLSPKLHIVENNEQNKLLTKLNDWEKNFLNIQVLDQKEIEDLPRVISNVSGTLLPHINEDMYISNLHRLNTKRPLAIYRLGRPITSPENRKKVLGYPLMYVGDVKLKKLDVQANLSIVTITYLNGEVMVGDRILVKKPTPKINLVKNNNPTLEGNIVYIPETSQMATTGQTVLINRGKKHGIQKGNRFYLIDNKPIHRSVQLYEKDFFDKNDAGAEKLVRLPDEKIGEIIVYNTYDDLSLALITSSKQPVYLNQRIKSKIKL